MTFTPLEAIFFAAFVSFMSGLAMRIYMGGKFVTKSACNECKQAQRAREEREEEKFSVLFQMLRSLIVHSAMPAEEKAKILNTAPH